MDIKDLEEMAVEVNINKNLIKVVSIEGVVKTIKGISKPIKISSITLETTIGKSMSPYITGYQKELLITLNSQNEVGKEYFLKFSGDSPIMTGDKVKAGIILDDDLKKYETGNLLYLGVLNENGFLKRLDFRDNYYPIVEAVKKLGLTS